MKLDDSDQLLPLERAEPVDGPMIPSVVDRRAGQVRPSIELLSGEKSAVIMLRAEVEAALIRDDPVLLCSACLKEVKVRASRLRRFFFRHIDESGDCEYKTGGMQSQSKILAIKYHGLKEGPDHRRIKSIVVESLTADTSFSCVKTEKNWRSLWDPSAFRRPDVQAVRDGLRIAFEIQLSTTFIDVIAARRAYYLAQGGLLFWVFKGLNQQDRKLTIDDVFIPNNHNLFVADDETLRLSRESGKLTLRCHYREPTLRDGEVVEIWHEQLVMIDQLTLDVPNQRAFFFDYAAARAALERRLRSADDQIRNDFQAFWERFGAGYDPAAEEEYKRVSAKIDDLKINVAAKHTDSEFSAAMRLCYSAKVGRPIGFEYENDRLIQVAHWAYDHHKPLLYAFTRLVEVYGHTPTLASQDRTGKWANRRKEAEQAWLESDNFQAEENVFDHDESYSDLLAFLFPEASKCFI